MGEAQGQVMAETRGHVDKANNLWPGLAEHSVYLP